MRFHCFPKNSETKKMGKRFPINLNKLQELILTIRVSGKSKPNVQILTFETGFLCVQVDLVLC